MDRSFLKGMPARQRGLSLIELMIAMVIGLVLLGGIIQTLLASKEASATRQSISTITDNARFMFDFMARDLRMAGRGFCNDAETAAFSDGCDGFDWPDDASSNPLAPVEFVDNVLFVRYETFHDADDDGDVEPVFIEARYALNGDNVTYSRLMTSTLSGGKFDLSSNKFKGYTNQPLVPGVSSLGFEFARYDADDTYGYHGSASTAGWGLTEWGRVTALNTRVTFMDVDPWGDGISDKEISFTVAMRNQISRWIP